MSVAVDPIASLQPWELVVEIGDREYTLPPTSAIQWLTVLLENPLDEAQILPGMLSEADGEELEDALMEGRVTSQEVRDAALEVIAAASGRDWWWTMRLIHTAAASWLIVYGNLIAQGVDPARLSLGALLDAMYVICASRMDKEQRLKFDNELEMPPTPEHIDEKQEEASFLALMNAGV